MEEGVTDDVSWSLEGTIICSLSVRRGCFFGRTPDGMDG
jgi:hypothetical protein